MQPSTSIVVKRHATERISEQRERGRGSKRQWDLNEIVESLFDDPEVGFNISIVQSTGDKLLIQCILVSRNLFVGETGRQVDGKD
jgi:hypothetical protein